MNSLVLLFGLSLPGAAEPPIDFNRDIRPILSNACFKCHGPGAQKGGLRLDDRAQALRKKAIVPGKASESTILTRLNADADDEEKMPPASAGHAPTAAQIALLTKWIDAGAEYGQHWAFIKPVRKPIPEVTDAAKARTEIDRFILAELQSRGLTLSAEADKSVQLRRVSLDLTGLLPTPAETEAFLKDTTPDAYEKVVDRLLASKAFAERQARHWLDLARYADSNGYTIDGPRQIWLYRDWVIDAFHEDMPFDRFTIEQLAGDLLPNATKSQQIATGFHRNTSFNEEGGSDPEQFRVERTIDRTNTTGSVWLGLTVGCSQCHDHKFDPIRQKEYFQLYAFFDSAKEVTLNNTTPEQEAERKRLRDAFADAKKQKLDKVLIEKAQMELRLFEGTAPGTLTMSDGPARQTYIHKRGDFLQRGENVEPGTPAILHAPTWKGRGTRLDLAKWLTASNNPITPRVVVNRMWQQYFGRGLVETENDLGMQGRPPTHPDLLDWLASEFVASGWKQKAMHKRIVMSAVYRQASLLTADVAAKDPNNYYLARQSRLRLEAEIIRDVALCASGLLSKKVGGPGVYPPQPLEVFSFTQNKRVWVESKGEDRYRRGMYTFLWRQSQHPLLTTFDGADAQTACTKRNRSNTPLQALHLANDPVFIELAQGLAKRIEKEGPSDDAGKLKFAYAVCFSREPMPAERDRLLQYLTHCREHDPATAWTLTARVLLNLDEMITRE